MKDNNLFPWFAFNNNNKKKTVWENAKSKIARATFLYMNGHGLVSPKGNWFLKILNLLIFNS